MTHLEFIYKTVMRMEAGCFERMKKTLYNKYIFFHFTKSENVSKSLLSEKLFDYFERVIQGNDKGMKKFDDLVEFYFSSWDSVVGPRIAKTPKSKKNEPSPEISRARKYYDKFSLLRKSADSVQDVIDYSRVMMCLYTEIINKRYNVIADFDYSLECLQPNKIIDSLADEREAILGKKLPLSKFLFSNHYGLDECFLIITIIMLYTIIGEKSDG